MKENKPFTTETVSRHVKAGKYETIERDATRLPAMVSIAQSSICVMPKDENLVFLTIAKNRQKDRNAVVVDWEDMQQFIDLMQDLLNARKIIRDRQLENINPEDLLDI